MKIWIQLVPVNLNTPFTNIPLQLKGLQEELLTYNSPKRIVSKKKVFQWLFCSPRNTFSVNL